MGAVVILLHPLWGLQLYLFFEPPPPDAPRGQWMSRASFTIRCWAQQFPNLTPEQTKAAFIEVLRTHYPAVLVYEWPCDCQTDHLHVVQAS